MKIRLLITIAAIIVISCESIPPIASINPAQSGENLICHAKDDCAKDENCIAQRCALLSLTTFPVTLRLTYPNALEAPVIQQVLFKPGNSLGSFIQPTRKPIAIQVEYNGNLIDGTASLTPINTWQNIDATQSGPLQTTDKSNILLNPGSYHLTVFPHLTPETEDIPTMFFDNINIEPHTETLHLQITNTPQPDQWWAGTVTAFYTYANQETATQVPTTLRIVNLSTPASSPAIKLAPPCDDHKCTLTAELPLPPQKLNTKHHYQLLASQTLTPTLTLNTQLHTFSIGSENTEDNNGYENILTPYQDFVIETPQTEQLRGQLLSPNAQLPANATVTISASTDSNQTYWTSAAHAPTSSDGYFTFDAPIFNDENPSFTWNVKIHFEQASPFASQTFTFTQQQDIQTIQIREKTKISGTVTHDGNQPVPNTVISFMPVNQPTAEPIEITTNEDGYYSTSLNYEAYTAIISPPKRTGLPTTVQNIDARSDTPISTNIELLRADVLYGACLDENTQPIPSVRAELFIQHDSKTIRLTSTETDETGIFRMFIPQITKIQTP